MSLTRIKAILVQEYFISIRSVEIINDLFLFPIFTNIIIFGFFTIYLIKNNLGFDPTAILMGMIFWQPIYIVSYSIGVGSLWNVWSKNLTNMFIAPISIKEYLLAYGISGVIKGILILILSYIVSFFIFKTNIFSIGILAIIFFFFNVSLFGFSLGIFNLGLIFRFGTRIQALAWGLVGVLQPVMAVIYPVSVLPKPFQFIAYLFPPTYIFEAIRKLINGSSDINNFYIMALITNILWLLFSINFFKIMFKKSKETGQFAKLEI